MSTLKDQSAAAVAKALGHPARLQIVRLLATQPECRGSEVFAELPLAQSTISQHLAALREAGLISSHAVGQGCVYCLNPDVIRDFADHLLAVVASTPVCSPNTKECR